MGKKDGKRGSNRDGGAPATSPDERRDDVKVVPFPGTRRAPAAGPERALRDLEDFDPGPGAA